MTKDSKLIAIDYIKKMEKINTQRLEHAKKELEFVKKEAQLFNEFTQNFQEIYGYDAD